MLLVSEIIGIGKGNQLESCWPRLAFAIDVNLLILWNEGADSHLRIFPRCKLDNGHLVFPNELLDQRISALAGAFHFLLIWEYEIGMPDIMINLQVTTIFKSKQLHASFRKILYLQHIFPSHSDFLSSERIERTNLIPIEHMVTFLTPDSQSRLQRLIILRVYVLRRWLRGLHNHREKVEANLASFGNLKRALALNFLPVLLLSDPLHKLLNSQMRCFDIKHALHAAHGDHLVVLKRNEIGVVPSHIELWSHLLGIGHWKQLDVNMK